MTSSSNAMTNAIRAYGETYSGDKVNLNKDIKRFAKYLKQILESPGRFIDFKASQEVINNMIYTSKGKVKMEGNFELNSTISKGWKLSGKAAYFVSMVGNDYGVYINFQNYPKKGKLYAPEGDGLELSDKIIGKPKMLTTHILDDDNLIELHGTSARANSLAGNDLFVIYATKSFLSGGKGEDSYRVAYPSEKTEVTINDFESSQDKIIISKNDVLKIETSMIGSNTRVDIGESTSILLAGVRLATEEIDFEIAKRNVNNLELTSLL